MSPPIEFPGFIPNPAVSTRLVEAGPLMGRDAGLAPEYERGDVLAWRSFGLGLSDPDWDFLRSLPFNTASSNFAKKAKTRSILAPVLPKSFHAHVLSHFLKSPKDAERLQDIIRRGTGSARESARKMFPAYRFTGENVTWRLTLTESEAMHYDSYGMAPDEKHHVRLFVNLDTQPRVWGIGPPVDWAIKKFPDRARRHAHLDANQFNLKFSEDLPWAEVPRHYVAFPPGSAWLCLSRVVAHEIVYGRRMLACTFDVDPADMVTPENHFNVRAERALREIGKE